MKKKVILDTDIGGDIDDALCLAYLLRQPNCDLLGITTVGGEVEKRAMVADAICKSAGRRVPIYAGADWQLLPSDLYPTPGGAPALSRWEHDRNFPQYRAVDFMRKTIREHPHQVSLLAIGHLTNIATLFLLDPAIAPLIKELHFMGGVFSPELERNEDMPMGNWNPWLDPHACAIVYQAAVPIIRTFGLNVTSKLVLPGREWENLFKTPLMQAVRDFGTPWLEGNPMTFHDPLVGASLFKPQVCEYQKGTIDVEFYDRNRLGMMDFTKDKKGRHEIAVSVDREAFFAHYFSVLE